LIPASVCQLERRGTLAGRATLLMSASSSISAFRARIALLLCACAVAALPQAAGRAGVAAQGPGPPRLLEAGGLRAWHVQGNVWMLAGAGANITVQASNAAAAGPGAGEGLLLVDTGRTEMSARVLDLLRLISPGRIEYIVNTQSDADHVGGNEAFAKPRMDFLWTPGTVLGPGVKVIAHESVLGRMSAPGEGGRPLYPVSAWPTYTFFSHERKIFFNDEPVIVTHEPAAHSDGDSVVFFRGSDVISAGDLFQTTSYPVIDRRQGGSLGGTVTALNHMLELMVPRYNQEGGTYVVPGHGRVGDQHDVLEYRDMLVIIGDRIRDGVRRGLTLAQIKAGRPTLDYDARWGVASGAWTTDMFIDAVYQESASPDPSKEGSFQEGTARK